MPDIGACLPRDIQGLCQGVEIELHEMLQNQNFLREQMVYLKKAKCK
jgi:hypothetical protein